MALFRRQKAPFSVLRDEALEHKPLIWPPLCRPIFWRPRARENVGRHFSARCLFDVTRQLCKIVCALFPSDHPLFWRGHETRAQRRCLVVRNGSSSSDCHERFHEPVDRKGLPLLCLWTPKASAGLAVICSSFLQCPFTAIPLPFSSQLRVEDGCGASTACRLFAIFRATLLSDSRPEGPASFRLYLLSLLSLLLYTPRVREAVRTIGTRHAPGNGSRPGRA